MRKVDVELTPTGQADFERFRNWRTLEPCMRALFRFAATGEGEIEHVPDMPGRLRLRAGAFTVVFTIDTDAAKLHVWRILRAP